MNAQGKDEARSIFDILNETQPDRQELAKLVGPLFTSLWTEILNMAFEWFPHVVGDGTDNERAFQAIRHRVLRVGNQKKRECLSILEDFAVQQLRRRETTTYEAPKHGPFALPVGVKMPSERRENK